MWGRIHSLSLPNHQAQTGLTNTLSSTHFSLGEIQKATISLLSHLPGLLGELRPRGRVSGSALSLPMDRTQERLRSYSPTRSIQTEGKATGLLPSLLLLLLLLVSHLIVIM